MKFVVNCNGDDVFTTESLLQAFEFAREDAFFNDYYQVWLGDTILAEPFMSIGDALESLFDLYADDEPVELDGRKVTVKTDGFLSYYYLDGKRYATGNALAQALYPDAGECKELGLGVPDVERVTARVQDILKESGTYEIEPGYWIYPADELAAEQKTWDDDDPGREVDSSEHPYWLLAQGENPGPFGYDSLEDIVEAFLNR